jgi:hypothetical protein
LKRDVERRSQGRNNREEPQRDGAAPEMDAHRDGKGLRRRGRLSQLIEGRFDLLQQRVVDRVSRVRTAEIATHATEHFPRDLLPVLDVWLAVSAKRC